MAQEEGVALARKHSFFFIETSALTAANVHAAFEVLLTGMFLPLPLPSWSMDHHHHRHLLPQSYCLLTLKNIMLRTFNEQT